ncbi:acyl-CoA dehydrogenase [Sphingomonadales bacterium 56]|uniref:Acyl-CoA/acyl-ACP dehydrogenase n=1 Tax=Sphingobium agri TaxID=2933566 RepID=A0ABT0DSG5_9SPHN|nr:MULTISPECIES: acyl-CoA dehydrogenase family protein [Sphingobium]MBY2930474.1 acyl-CoA dehydrogenase [Sphingomonadales bacterium 56]MBY2960512.1 acyl-CoA dehydrogenase [Sphingomonadales bacterium 58]MCK0530055.1 acyl-CoA/acyl-ACP dehydrogenase [Sphingobium agri]CAD7341351.1 Acyl-CoA dehydrogenase fadE12 [Sphingobium sp. S8]CAD7341380.1 Acyl-CoA dehydrogenase fadE12 [Sphingobium sp. S6]
MDISLSEEQEAIRDSVRKVCDQFGDEYWSRCEDEKIFPSEFHRAMADAGWLGITMPEEFGGANLGVTEAAIMMHEVSASAGGYSAASTIHLNIFGPHAVVVHGTDEQKRRMLGPLIAGADRACFGVTEPDAGLDTTSIKTFATKVPGGYRVTGRKIWTSSGQVANKILLLTRTTPKEQCKKPTDGMTLFYTDLDKSQVEVRRIPKMGRNAVDSNATFIDDYFVPDEDRIGEEGKGFHYILHSLNPERILVGIEAVGLGRGALARAAKYASERKVFGRYIGQNQGIQHPLAENWTYLESAYWMIMRAANLYDTGKPCGAEANAGKFLGGRAAFDACTRAVMTHGGMGYSTEYQVERLFRESILMRIAPITEQLILSFIAEKVLDLPKSY